MKKIIIVLVMAFLLSGCTSGEKLNFSGSSANWEVVYTAVVTGETDQQTSGTIQYIGGNEAPEVIDYKIEYKNENNNSSAGNSETEASLSGETVEFEGAVCGNCAIIQENEEIEAEITWNGQTETIVLENDN